MLWQQKGYRENMFVGRAAYGWYRPQQLGQIFENLIPATTEAVQQYEASQPPMVPAAPPVMPAG